MKLFIIRHGAPNYAKDTLTEQGWREQELLTPFLVAKKPDVVCLSSLGRAQDTAKGVLRETGIRPLVFPWLCEFDARLPEPFADRCPWHLNPMDWSKNPAWLGPDWQEDPFFRDTEFLRTYQADAASLDAFLAEHGYHREGRFYRVSEEFFDTNETIMMFCHLGRGQMLLSHLLSMPWMQIHYFWLPTSSITEVIFERSPFDRSLALARCATVGSVPHLDAAGVARCNSGFMMPIDGYTREVDRPADLSQ